MRPLLTLIFLFFLHSISAQQERDDFFRSLGLDSLSAAGKDTIYQVLQNERKYLFALQHRVEDPIPIPRVKDTVRAVFAGRISAVDQSLLDDYWDNRQGEYVKTIQRIDPIYQHAIACQQRTMDSLLLAYSEVFSTTGKSLDSLITDLEIVKLKDYLTARKPGFERKRKEFIKYYYDFTFEITPSLHEYITQGFNFMEEVPSAYYLDLTGGDRGKIPFVENFSDHPFVGVYREFESALDSLFTLDNECRGHQAIPFYHQELPNKPYYTILNALLFAQINGLLREADPSENKEWAELEKMVIQNEYWIDTLLDQSVIDQLEMIRHPLMADSTSAFVRYANHELFGILLAAIDLEDPMEELQDFKAKNSFKEVHFAEVNNHRVVYTVSDEGAGISMTEGYVLSKNFMLQFLFTTDSSSTELLNVLRMLKGS